MAHVYQEYPKVIYHHKKAPTGRRVENAAEEPQGWWARRGWVDTPNKFPKASRLNTVIKPLWDEYGWIVGPLTALTVFSEGIIRVIRAALE